MLDGRGMLSLQVMAHGQKGDAFIHWFPSMIRSPCLELGRPFVGLQEREIRILTCSVSQQVSCLPAIRFLSSSELVGLV